MTPDPIILFELLVQLRGFAVINARQLTTTNLTSIHSFHSIGRIPIVTLRQALEPRRLCRLQNDSLIGTPPERSIGDRLYL